MTRIQLSTSVSARTRQQVDDLREVTGGTVHDIVTVAIDRYHHQIERSNMIENCPDCGLSRTPDGFAHAWPSDCHAEGGHYQAYYDEDGKFLWSHAPWQIFTSHGDLTQELMKAI